MMGNHKGKFLVIIILVHLRLVQQCTWHFIYSSIKKSRRHIKEDLLYSSSPLEFGGGFVELNDEELLKREILELTTRRNQLQKEILLCQEFVRDKSSSQYFRFIYLLTKLNMARKCTQNNKSSLLTADYFSTVLAKRKELLEEVKQSVQLHQEQVDSLIAEKEHLQRSTADCLEHWQQVDQQVSKDHDIADVDRLKAFRSGFGKESQIRHFDEKLGSIITAMKEQIISSKKKAKSTMLFRGINGNDKVEVEMNYQSLHSDEALTNDFKLSLKEFESNVGDTMSRCYLLVEESMRRKNRTRAALLADENNLLAIKVKQVESVLEQRQVTSTRVQQLLNDVRMRTLDNLQAKIDVPKSMVIHSDQAFLSHLKVIYRLFLSNFLSTYVIFNF